MSGYGWLQGLRLVVALVFAGLWAVIGLGDLREQRVAHRYVAGGAALVAACYALLFANTLAGIAGWSSQFHYWGFYGNVGTHIFLASSAAMLLWFLRIWPAGDAKLFMLLSAAYPLLDLTGDFFPSRLFFTTLVNIFVPACLGVLARAAFYFFDTRLRPYRTVFAGLGWVGELRLLGSSVAQAAAAGRRRAKETALRLSAQDWRARAAAARAGAAWLLPAAGQWAVGLSSMALLSYYVHGLLSSPVLLSILCFGVFMAWSQISRSLGPWPSRLAAGAAVAALLWFKPPQDWTMVASLLRSITVFSFFMFLGTQWASSSISMGGLGSVVSFVIPLVITWGVYAGQNALRWAWRSAMAAGRSGGEMTAQAGGLAAEGHRLGPAAAARLHLAALFLGSLVPSGNPVYAFLGKLAVLGLFFGLSLVLVRVWDDEVRPTRSSDSIVPRLMLAPAFVDTLREDEEFFDAHFGALYADGLTPDQAAALSRWCRERGVERVPLAPTVSFASWIFLGFLLSLILRQDVIHMVL